MENNNVNQKIEELTDEQLKEVAGGQSMWGSIEICELSISFGCQNFDVKQCKCLD